MGYRAQLCDQTREWLTDRGNSFRFAQVFATSKNFGLFWLELIATKVPRKQLTVTFIRTLFVSFYVTGDNAVQATSDAIDNTSTSESDQRSSKTTGCLYCCNAHFEVSLNITHQQMH